jgi:hypothetical protein
MAVSLQEADALPAMRGPPVQECRALECIGREQMMIADNFLCFPQHESRPRGVGLYSSMGLPNRGQHGDESEENCFSQRYLPNINCGDSCDASESAAERIAEPRESLGTPEQRVRPRGIDSVVLLCVVAGIVIIVRGMS